VKALLLKGRALHDLTEFDAAIEHFQNMVETLPENEEAKAELAKCEASQKKYKDKESDMCKKMFKWLIMYL